MSHQAFTWVLQQGPRLDDVDRNGKPYAGRARGYRAVLASIANVANGDGHHAHPGQQAISDESLYGRSQVLAIIDELIAEGWLTIEAAGGGRGKATVYRIEMARRDTVQSSDGIGEGNRAVGAAKPRDLTPETARSDPGNRAVAPALTSGDATANVLPTKNLNEEPNVSASADVERLCSLLADLIEANGSKRPQVTARWRSECDRLLRLDGRTPEQVEKAIRWAQGDSFWRGNVLSMPKLREKYDQLRLAAKRDEPTRPARSATGPGALVNDRWDRANTGGVVDAKAQLR